jgi:hypothetical protein
MEFYPNQVGRSKEPKVLKRQPKSQNPHVTQVSSRGGMAFDICVQCQHWTSKPVTNMTTCSCCKKGHSTS